MRILLVVHGFPPAGAGGTELYVHDLAVALAASPGDDIFVLTRDADPRRPELSVRTRSQGRITVVAINNTFQACASFEESYTYPALRRLAADAIDYIRPDVVHVQHLTCLSTGVLEDITERGVPIVMTLNDYWLICHRGQLLDLDDERCEGPFDGGCGRCLAAGLLASPRSYRAGRLARVLPVPGAARLVQMAAKTFEAAMPLERIRRATVERLAHMREAAAHVDLFLAPSETLAEWFRRFGIPSDRLIRGNQGINLAPFTTAARSPSRVLRVGFAGSLIPSKAPHVLLEAVQQLPAGTATVDILGAGSIYHGDPDYARRLEPLLTHAAVRRLGPVPHERMARALTAVDVVVVPSVWIENAPFIIREAFAAGAPVIASGLGGMAEMVRDGIDGLLFPPGDAAALRSHLRRLAGDAGLLERLRAGIVRPMSIETDAATLRTMYERLTAVRPRRVSSRLTYAPAPADDSRVTAVVLNYRTADETWLAVRSLQTSFRPPDRILIVDNGSGDGSAAALRCSLDGIEILEAQNNGGFSAGCNIGIRAALVDKTDFVLLVNSDAVVAPDATARLLDAARSDPTLGILAPVLLSREEPDRIASAGISFSALTGRMRHRSAGLPVSLLPPGTTHVVDAVSGCVMLIRRGVLEGAGLLDEHYFFSFEDIDLCLRAQAAGFSTACAHESFAYHEGGRTIGRRSARRVYFATRNHLRLAGIAGAPSGKWLRSGFVVGLNAAYVLVAREAPLLRGLAAVVRGAWHHTIGRYGPD